MGKPFALGHCHSVAAWLSGKRVGLDQRSCSTPGPVSTGMGDRSRIAGTILVFNQSHPGLLSLAIPPWVGTMSTGGGLRHL